MAAPASTSILDIASTPKAAAKKTSSSVADSFNSMAEKKKPFSEVYNDSVGSASERKDTSKPEASREEASSARSDNRSHEADRKKDGHEEDRAVEESDNGGDSLPVKEASAGEVDDPKADAGETADEGGGEAVVEAVVAEELLAQDLSVANTETSDEVVEFITTLAALAGGKGGQVKGAEVADAGEAGTELAKVIQSILKNAKGKQGVENALKGVEPEKVAEVSQLLKDFIGKVSAPSLNLKAGGSDQQGLEAILAKLADSGQIKLPAQNASIPGQLAMQLSPARADAGIASGPYITTLQQSLQHPEWKDGMANKVMWMVNQNIQSAKIHLNPAELGPIEMKIQVHKDQAHIQVHSQHAVTRDLMEGTVNRLRDMLADQGIELSQFDVSSQQGEQSGAESGDGQDESGNQDLAMADDLQGEETSHGVEQGLALDQLVDYYV
ncbi:flagellar hook-length control protein FliK [Hahella ganghwensis]|uniref:flagellar hook-length control protein FliK n=1 Tax=Hahella ganghwensis TaxID=286420 RepID=UPI000379E0A9|nr:flagellar hook-length control protein FliK [Hahella ganghwensis]